MGVSVERIHASSVTSGTSDCRKKTVRFGSKPAGEKIQRHVQGIFAPLRRVEQRGHGMVVGDEIKRLAFFLQLDGGPHHPEIISEMQRAAGLDA